MSAVKRAGFIYDRMSYIILRGRWCDVIVLTVHAPTEDKINYMKGSFYEELKRVFDKFPKCHMKILLRNFSAKVGREDIFKRTLGNERLHEISNDNGVTSSKLCYIQISAKSTMFPYRNIHKFTWTSPVGKTRIKLTIFL
jgi:hypothetical protein